MEQNVKLLVKMENFKKLLLVLVDILVKIAIPHVVNVTVLQQNAQLVVELCIYSTMNVKALVLPKHIRKQGYLYLVVPEEVVEAIYVKIATQHAMNVLAV